MLRHRNTFCLLRFESIFAIRSFTSNSICGTLSYHALQVCSASWCHSVRQEFFTDNRLCFKFFDILVYYSYILEKIISQALIPFFTSAVLNNFCCVLTSITFTLLCPWLNKHTLKPITVRVVLWRLCSICKYIKRVRFVYKKVPIIGF